ncbi:MAG: efflux RND transporter permease subunit, partial [Planctomycetaceae bacterium]|nr:efflux RND transporter permease subunit [Planctomycetaceae bacterium]
MSLPQIAVRRPITTLMVSIALALLGGVAVTRLSVDLMPDMEFPTVTVTTLYPGAGPEEVETLITRPLEQTLSSVNGFDRLTSTSLEGSSGIRIQFRWGTNLDVAVDEMRQAIDKVRADLPEDIDPPLMRRYDSNDQPILYLGLKSDRPVTALTTMAEKSIVPRLERLDGIARIGMRGGIRREIQIEVDRAKLDALGMGINEVVDALQQANISRPAGDFADGNVHRLIRSRSEFQSLEEIRNLVVRRNGDAAIRIRDIADLVDGHERITQRTRTNGEAGIMLYVFKQAGANTIDVSDEVYKEVAALNREFQDAELVVRLDKSDYIRSAIKNLQQSAAFGMTLAMAILVIFLRSFRSTLIIGISMPLSILATLIFVYLQGYTLNMVSFGGLALGIGMLVDNSIVVLESIFRRREEGEDAKTAAISGTNEVASAITASTLTTLIVFLPLIFVQGMTGLLLHQLAFVVALSLLCSLFISMTLTPVLAAYWLGSTQEKQRPGWWTWLTAPSRGMHRLTDAMFRGVENVYGRMVSACLRFPLVASLVMVMILSVSLGLLPRVGTDFLPKTDDGRLGIIMQMVPGI